MPPFWKRHKSQPKEAIEPTNTPSRYGRHELPDSSLPIRSKPENPFLQRADEHFNKGTYTSAVYMYEEALNEDLDNQVILLQLALARTMCSPPQFNEAMRDVNRVIQLNMSNGGAWRLKGNIHAQQNDINSAENAFIQATHLLQGFDKLQVQQALADVRLRKLAPPQPQIQPSTTPRVELPIQTQGINLNTNLANANANVHPPPQQQTRRIPTQPSTSPQVTNIENLSQPPLQPVQRSPSISTASQPQSPSLSSPSALSPQSTAAAPVSPSSPNPPSARPTTPNVYQQGEVLAQQLDIPADAPPSYSATPPQVSLPALETDAISSTSAATFQSLIATKRQGSLYLKPVTLEGQIDSVQLFFYGKTYLQSIVMDLKPAQASHLSWKKYHVSPITHPGDKFIDYDCESTASYEGNHVGTTSVLGYAEEYREQQLLLAPLLELTFEASTIPPLLGLDKTVQRVQLLQGNPNLEDNPGLDQILGIPAAATFATPATTKQMVEEICMVHNRALFDAPGRFIDFLKSQSFSVHFFGTGGIGFTNFLFLMLLGAELSIRLKKLGYGQAYYPNVIKPTISALVVIAKQWMENVTIRRSPTGSYVLAATYYASQIEGLVQFAEAIGWPYMDETRLETAGLFTKLTSNPANVHNYLKDWMYGLVLPGKFFRHRILSCLVLASPTIKHLGYAPYYDSGLIVGDKSYWSKRTVLGRVLGGLQNARSTCGWIGPCMVPSGFQSGWVLIHARKVDFITPVVDDLTQTDLEVLGFSETDADHDPLTLLRDITDMRKWETPQGLPARPSSSIAARDSASVQLSAIRLTEVMDTNVVARQFRATLDFLFQGRTTSFTLYSNPVFVHVPKCAGPGHPIHERMVRKLFTNVTLAKNLKNAVLPSLAAAQTMIIDATGNGEEAMARAWCAETGRHAVIRKAGIGCFTCAVNLAAKRTGLGFNVLIWCN